jgi:hypothetical protein
MNNDMKIASKYYIEGARLLGIYSYITGDTVLINAGARDQTEIGMGIEITEDMIVPPVQPLPADLFLGKVAKATMEEKLDDKYTSFKDIVLDLCVFHRTYVVTSSELHKIICENFDTEISHNTHFPRLLTRFILENPQYEISKKRESTGVVYCGLSLRSLSEINRRRIKRPTISSSINVVPETVPKIPMSLKLISVQ